MGSVTKLSLTINYKVKLLQLFYWELLGDTTFESGEINVFIENLEINQNQVNRFSLQYPEFLTRFPNMRDKYYVLQEKREVFDETLNKMVNKLVYRLRFDGDEEALQGRERQGEQNQDDE